MAVYNENEFKVLLRQFWNPNTVEAMGRIIMEWDSNGLPPGVTVEDDNELQCDIRYDAYGQIKYGNEIVASIYRYGKISETIDVLINKINNVRKITPTLRVIYGVGTDGGYFSKFADATPGKVVLMERVPVQSMGTIEEWVSTLPGDASSAYALISLAYQINYLFDLLVMEGFNGDLDALADVQVIEVPKNSTIECYDKEIQTYGVMPFLVNTLRLKIDKRVDDVPVTAILNHVLSIASTSDSKIADVINPIRRRLDTIDFTVLLNGYLEIAPDLVVDQESADREILTCTQFTCKDAAFIYNMLKGKNQFLTILAQKHIEFLNRARTGNYDPEIEDLVRDMTSYLIYKYKTQPSGAGTIPEIKRQFELIQQPQQSVLKIDKEDKLPPQPPSIDKIWLYEQKYQQLLTQNFNADKEECTLVPIPFTDAHFNNSKVNAKVVFDSLKYDIEMNKREGKTFTIKTKDKLISLVGVNKDGYITSEGKQLTAGDLYSLGYDVYHYSVISGSDISKGPQPDTATVTTDRGPIVIPIANIGVYDSNCSNGRSSKLINTYILLTLMAESNINM